MKRFEYKTIIRRTYNLMSDGELDSEGKFGWELASFFIGEKAVYIFKREMCK